MKEGLQPTFDDIVLLNNLGLKVERGSDMFSFSACPRIAFLGDTILREPTIAKRIWIDEAQRLFADSLETKIYILTYALATADNELPSLYQKSKIQDQIIKFRDEVLLKYTDTQIIAAIDYCLNGIKPDLDLPEDPTEEDKKRVKDLAEIYDIPEEGHSVARQILYQALSYQIPPETAQYALYDDLERLIICAAINQKNGSDILKNQQTEAAGRFYIASGKIHQRLISEKEKHEK